MDTKVSVTLAAYIYFVFAGVSYLWGYWLPFELNILAFADFTDILKVSIYPALPAIGLLVTYAAIDGLGVISKKQHDDLIDAGGVFRLYIRVVTIFNVLFMIGLAFYFAYLVITEPAYHKLKGVYPLASLLAFYYFLYGNKQLMALDVRVRAFALALLCGLPTYVFLKGAMASDDLINLRGSYWVITAKEPCAGAKGDLVYIARIGGKYFSMSVADKSLCVIEDGTVQLVKKP